MQTDSKLNLSLAPTQKKTKKQMNKIRKIVNFIRTETINQPGVNVCFIWGIRGE